MKFISSDNLLYILDKLKTLFDNLYAPKTHGTHLELGDNNYNAYPGDQGKIAYEHSQAEHAPSNAQSNSDITKQEIEDKLTGTITSHNHNDTHAPVSHGYHVPTPQTQNNAVFLRNDNTWQTVTAKNIGAATAQNMNGAAMSNYATWYRIAQSPSGINNDLGCFDIVASGNSTRSLTRLLAGISFGKNPVLQQIGHIPHNSTSISKARIVYHETYSKNYAYLEVYVPSISYAI